MTTQDPSHLPLSIRARETLQAAVERIFPADGDTPGAGEIGVLEYVLRALSGPYQHCLPLYKAGLEALDRAARVRYGTHFAGCSARRQDSLLTELEGGTIMDSATGPEFFALLLAHTQEGLFADPRHGGNRNKLGWRAIEHPGLWLQNTAAENVAPYPVTKGGEIHALADVPLPVFPAIPDTSLNTAIPDDAADVVLVGVGAMGSLAARLLAEAGLRVIGLEAGPWRGPDDFVPDELSSAYYCRGDMGRKFLDELPTWRPDAATPTREAPISLGRMMNGVGGSVIHWGGALRRFHPHHFRYRSHVVDRYGAAALPEGSTLVDWPVTYADLAPCYEVLEREIGVAGDAAANPFLPDVPPYPLPSTRPFTGGELFRRAACTLGLHPYPTPVAINTMPYNGAPASSYCAWMGGFGPFQNDRWYPGQTWVPQALRTGNFDLRPGSRVLRIVTDCAGHADGVEYVDGSGRTRKVRARSVILAGYTFENVRLMLLSGDARHPGGLGNNRGQAGRHFMVKGWGDVYGHFPDTVFNAHTGPAAQMWGLDDFVAESFDSLAHGFIGGFTPNVENQRLPIQVSREDLPPGATRWGKPYFDFVRQWQHRYAVRLQPDALPYEDSTVDLDPHRRDSQGMPVIRITYHLHPNERRQAVWAEERGHELLRAMGAVQTWHQPRFAVCSSHDLGGLRMGEDPAHAVVSPALNVHDTPGLYVFSGAVFPTCPGINPTLTMWALCRLATKQLTQRLRSGVST